MKYHICAVELLIWATSSRLAAIPYRHQVHIVIVGICAQNIHYRRIKLFMKKQPKENLRHAVSRLQIAPATAAPFQSHVNNSLITNMKVI